MRDTSTAPLNRRMFFRNAAIAGTAVAVPAWLLSGCSGAGSAGTAPAPNAAGLTTLKATHGTGLCNLGIFLTKERKLSETDGAAIDFVVTPTNADIVTLFGAGQVDMSLIPYTQFLTLYDAGAPVTIVAGGGVEGCSIVAQPGITSAADLKGKTLGTFQADTLEMLPYDYLKKAGLSFKDINVRYFGTSPELAQAFVSGSIDSMSHIEPYVTQALNARSGSVLLSDGKDVYGPGYTDCVLAVRNPLLKENPKAIKAVIKGLFEAQQQAETDRRAAVSQVVGSYFKTSLDDALAASTKQPNVVDQRNKTQFMLERAVGMKDLGYLKKLPDEKIADWSLLEDVINENQSLYNSLKLKTA
ncbi:ABC transporter substrate-binding protein [Mycolicibacterium rhodesiae]|uniref:ABC transporter substrate-binding protein n=1 Tax=Mycolicibacterium rhodesiae TaxID=36814 RepID=A0A1X0J1S6_MYCRH|nr:ABC transporter substrate-binding protein [Mycolicibacterium rhodesiae]MCV7344762.1 ABC transporter substrate-binding protein [Mycolicibacterium rhodesiae]ORB55776.1 ABC transporter substrate-binding protein [Mycolicibacterium rhodesiae]